MWQTKDGGLFLSGKGCPNRWTYCIDVKGNSDCVICVIFDRNSVHREFYVYNEERRTVCSC